MNWLTDPLPASLTLGGTEIPIKTDFRAVLHYDRILKEDTKDALAKAIDVLLTDPVPQGVSGEELVRAVNWFVACGQEEKKHKPSNKLLGINKDTPMDYEKDSMIIWSAFRRVYGIDLNTIEELHWWRFHAMLAELPEDVQLNRIISIRTKDLTQKHMSKEEKMVYRALQAYYRIRPEQSERERLLNEALKNGEDPTPYL